jgi:hypothetical protein
MALDSADKRASALGVNASSPKAFPTPDGSLASQADRQHCAGVYRGVLADAGSASAALYFRRYVLNQRRL